MQHLNPQVKDPQRIKKDDKKYVEKLDCTGIEFPVNVEQYNKIEKQNTIRIKELKGGAELKEWHQSSEPLKCK